MFGKKQRSVFTTTDKQFLLVFFFLTTTALCLQAQDSKKNTLFDDQSPIDLRVVLPIKEVKKSTNDSTYLSAAIHYKTQGSDWDSLQTQVRIRGFYRKNNCYFPPLKIKIDKEERKNSLFDENKNLKLVLPCQQGASYNDLVLKEYICYKLYEHLTPYFFPTRLTNVTLVDNSRKNPKTHELQGFLVEDDDKLAKRFGGKIMDDLQLHPIRLSDTVSTIHDFFQYMISNLDWSTTVQHNVKVMRLENGEYIPLAYDFDMSGLVNAPYAVVNEMFNASSVRQRIYRGFCRDESLFEYVRNEYLQREGQLVTTMNTLEGGLNKMELSSVKSYVEKFFDILRDDKTFRANIIDACRTK